ncbi:MAG: hypothetical protein WED10_01270 [Brumimicrobium sp.]
MNEELETSEYVFSRGKLLVWKEADYEEKVKKGGKKSEVETTAINKKLKEIGVDQPIEHDKNGAPIIHDKFYAEVSISHYGGWYAVLLSEVNCGVDIQPFKNSLLKGRNYFVNDSEELSLELTNTNLHLIWSAKETFYKFLNGNIEDLKNEVSIMEILMEDRIVKATYRSKNYELYFDVNELFVLVYIL